MKLVSRYTPGLYLVGFFVSAVIAFAINVLIGVVQLAGHSIAPLSVLGFYSSFVNIAFYITTGISAVVGVFVIIATAVQMSMVEFWPAHIDKEHEERTRFVRGLVMVFFCLCMSIASWVMTKSAENLAYGSTIMSDFFIVPVLTALVFYGAALTQWPMAARLVR